MGKQLNKEIKRRRRKQLLKRRKEGVRAAKANPGAARKAAAAHPIEKVGAELRAMMPWIGANKLVDKDKN
jgi:ketol-acid reductoisomerase